MTTAAAHLGQFNVSVQQAFDFIAGNLNTPGNIYNVAKQFKITNQMLAEIVGQAAPGVTATDIKNWFNSQGFDANSLDQTSGTIGNNGGAITNPGDVTLINTSMSALTSQLQSIGMLDFSNRIMGAWRDAGADFDMDGAAERSGENLGGRSLSEVGLTYLLNVGLRLTEADTQAMTNSMSNLSSLMSNPQGASSFWDGMMNVYNGALARPAPTAVTQEMLDSVASGYVTVIGQIKPMVDMMTGYGIDIL
ncbi:hypothetical protein [Azonexus sp.]|uniref:hypothetical protein n=1 Tax=Azonexus sp. TaxID=1872668 RepID=UPI0027BAE0BC|nr:hypothetical protein [Azonexus sp.]